jgi:glycosyltransferase involved in cell wall biosynthesis
MVSIIIPFKNAAPWIEATLDSILKQDYKNWEVIAVEDHSSDGSTTLLEKYKAPNIKVFKNQKEGIIPALQLGLAHSKGEFITRMDADDIMPLGRLKSMVEEIEKSPKKTIVTGKIQYFSNSIVSDGYRKYERWLNDRIEQNDHWNHIYRECVVASPNWIARRSDLIENKIFDELRYPEDYDMTFQWFHKAFTIKGIDEVTLNWREHPDRTSRNSAVYDQQSFFQLKLDWFLKIHPNIQNIGLLGAGQKGKITAQHFINNNISFEWYDLNYKSYNTPLFGQEIKDYNLMKKKMLLIGVYPEQEAFDNFLKEKGFVLGENAWYL